MFYFVRCINIAFNSLLVQLVKCDVHTTRKIKFIHAIFITYYYFMQQEQKQIQKRDSFRAG